MGCGLLNGEEAALWLLLVNAVPGVAEANVQDKPLDAKDGYEPETRA